MAWQPLTWRASLTCPSSVAMAYVTMIDAAIQTMHDLTEQIATQIAARSGSGGHGGPLGGWQGESPSRRVSATESGGGGGGGGFGAGGGGRGLRSSTFQLNLSHFLSRKPPRTPTVSRKKCSR